MKLYNSKEVRAILKVAAENTSTDEADTQTGLSLDELRQLASEAGIDPEQVSRAAGEIDANSRVYDRTFWGGPFSYNNQVLIDSEITMGKWEEMLLPIRDFFKSEGKVTTRDSVYEWSSPWGTTNSAKVTALKVDGKTKINVSWNGPLTAIPYYIPVPLVGIASLFFASEFLELTAVSGVAFTLLATALTFLAGRWTLRKNLENGFKKLRTMLYGLEIIASRPISKSESGRKSTNKNEVPVETDHSLNNILIEDDPTEPHSKTTRQDRSRT